MGESVAVLIATQAWINVIEDLGLSTDSGYTTIAPSNYEDMAGVDQAYEADVMELPVVWAFSDKEFNTLYEMTTSAGDKINGSFINYNAILGTKPATSGTAPEGCTGQIVNISDEEYNMAGIYFDANCFRVTSGFATNSAGRVLFNNITGNLSKTGRVEYIPSGAKFDSYLVKDASGTYMGIALTQLGA